MPKRIHPCPDCGKGTRYSRCLKCARRAAGNEKIQKRPTAECPTCGNTFTFIPSEPKIYCSSRCFYEKDGTPKTVPCATCGTGIRVTIRSRSKYCSKRCYRKSLLGNKHKKGKGANHPTVWTKGDPRCSGKNHWKWRGGIGKQYYGVAWKKLSRDIRNGLGKCEACGNKEKLQVHHKIPYRYSRSHSKSNLAVLCAVCHGKADRDFDRAVSVIFPEWKQQVVERTKKHHPDTSNPVKCG